jgi:hypothetical protein
VELAGGVIGQEFWVKVSDAYWLFDDRYAAKGLREKSKREHRIHPSDKEFRNLKPSEVI